MRETANIAMDDETKAFGRHTRNTLSDKHAWVGEAIAKGKSSLYVALQAFEAAYYRGKVLAGAITVSLELGQKDDGGWSISGENLVLLGEICKQLKDLDDIIEKRFSV